MRGSITVGSLLRPQAHLLQGQGGYSVILRLLLLHLPRMMTPVRRSPEAQV